MGLCLSCLSGSQSDEDDETTSLLRRSQQNQSPDYLQEEELMKQHKRQQELNHIVNDLSDKLIDVASFLSSKNHANNYNNYNNGNTSSSTKPSLSTQLSTMGLNTQTSFGNLSLGDIRDEETSSASVSRQYPYIYNQSEKEKVLRKSKSLGDSVRQACQVTVSEPLYLKF